MYVVTASLLTRRRIKPIKRASTVIFLQLTFDEIHVRELQNVKNIVLKNKYVQCGNLYTAAANALIQSRGFLKARNYQKLPSLATTALKKVQDCDKIFTPPGSETRFKSLSYQSINRCNNVLAVVKGLAR